MTSQKDKEAFALIKELQSKNNVNVSKLGALIQNHKPMEDTQSETSGITTEALIFDMTEFQRKEEG